MNEGSNPLGESGKWNWEKWKMDLGKVESGLGESGKWFWGKWKMDLGKVENGFGGKWILVVEGCWGKSLGR